MSRRLYSMLTRFLVLIVICSSLVASSTARAKESVQYNGAGNCKDTTQWVQPTDPKTNAPIAGQKPIPITVHLCEQPGGANGSQQTPTQTAASSFDETDLWCSWNSGAIVYFSAFPGWGWGKFYYWYYDDNGRRTWTSIQYDITPCSGNCIGFVRAPGDPSREYYHFTLYWTDFAEISSSSCW